MNIILNSLSGAFEICKRGWSPQFKLRLGSELILLIKAYNIIEVLWHPPLVGWVKCNTDGATHGSPDPSACGGLFRNCHGVHLGSFADFLGQSYAFVVELSGVMCAIEAAFDRV
ncbi:ribonuclease H [Trifolium pratense]|uniref:Ribonuclease H n=1 Tax=Trifolium pratense TaxID=57577 RepID=A0A2K3KPC9_TRIPR|nr:ribonuclease H [Trifolium pratense]